MKRGGDCLYDKEKLLLRHIKTDYFPQCLLCRISLRIGHPIKITINYRPSFPIHIV